MSSYIVIKNGTQNKSYNIKSTYTGDSYIKVGTYGYLNLTTATTTGLNLKIKQNNKTYRIVNTYTTTSSSSSQYTYTSGYSGYTSSVRTTGSGYSTSSYTSVTAYSGMSSSVYNMQVTTARGINSVTNTVTSSLSTVRS